MNTRPWLSPLLLAALLASPLALAQNVDAAAQATADQAKTVRSPTPATEVARIKQVEKARQGGRLEQASEQVKTPAKKPADQTKQAGQNADPAAPVEPEEEDDR